jgi:hypothetical protein
MYYYPAPASIRLEPQSNPMPLPPLVFDSQTLLPPLLNPQRMKHHASYPVADGPALLRRKLLDPQVQRFTDFEVSGRLAIW